MLTLHFLFRRGDRIRTCDPLVPNQVRYQLRHTPKTDFSLFTQAFHLHYTATQPANCIAFYHRRGDRIRTCDPLVPNQVRYQLRHTPKIFSPTKQVFFLIGVQI